MLSGISSILKRALVLLFEKNESLFEDNKNSTLQSSDQMLVGENLPEKVIVSPGFSSFLSISFKMTEASSGCSKLIDWPVTVASPKLVIFPSKAISGFLSLYGTPILL